jgi:hypothetical protein
VRIGDVPIDYEVTIGDQGFALRLDRTVRRSEEVVTFTFDSPVYVPGTRFGGRVYESSRTEAGQQIVPGDASPTIDSDNLAVSWDLEGELIGNLTVSPTWITPNNDGVNDAVTISVGVLQLLEAGAVSIGIFDLSGRLIWESRELRGSGPGSAVWSGVDRHGQRVIPGVYVYRVSVEAAAGKDTRTGVIGVAY